MDDGERRQVKQKKIGKELENMGRQRQRVSDREASGEQGGSSTDGSLQ